MALLTLHRSPSISTTPDESIPRRGRLQKRESFLLVKGAVLLLEEGNREGPNEETSPDQAVPPKVGSRASDWQHCHLHAMVSLLRPEDSIRLAVRLESVSPVRVRYLIVVSTLANKQESVLLGMDFPSRESDQCTIGLVLPVWSDTQVYLDGDGGFSVTSAEHTKIFKPVSIQTMWSVLQALHGCCERAVKGAVIPGCGLDWAKYYQLHVESDRLCLNEWGAMTDLESVRRDSAGPSSSDRVSVERQIKDELRAIMRTEDLESITSKQVRSSLEARLGLDMKNYKEYIDNEMMVTMAQMDKPSKIFDYLYLGSEWNAANFEELQKNNVGYILNVTREIDNFYPEAFTYMNIRVYDVDSTDLLSHWKDTYTFISTARQSGQAVLVHCKMGVSRSASTVIAYAMKQHQWPLEVALAYVRDRRPIVHPNDGFTKQLNTYNGILKASQQRHSLLWRRKSREQRRMSLHKSEQGEDQSESESEEEEEEGKEREEDLEGVEGELESSDDDDEDDNGHEEEVFVLDSTPQSEPSEKAPPPEPTPANPSVTVQEGDKGSLSRSGRMNLFSLMQSISEWDEEERGNELLTACHRRSPGQRRRSQGKRGLMHQRACVDFSPEPRSQSGSRKAEKAGLSKPGPDGEEEQ